MIALLICACICACDTHTVEDHLRIAAELEKAGNLDSALEHLDVAVARNPKHLWARLERGTMRSRMGDQAGAIAEDDTVVRLDPGNTTAYFNRALAKGRASDHVGALNDLKQAMRVNNPMGSFEVTFMPTDDPNDTESPDYDIPQGDLAYAFALTYLELDSDAAALDWLNNSLVLGSNTSDCFYERGILLLKHGQDSAGCADLERASILRDDRAVKAWGKHCSKR